MAAFDSDAFSTDAFSEDAFDFGDGETPSEPATIVSRNVTVVRFQADATVFSMSADAEVVDFTR